MAYTIADDVYSNNLDFATSKDLREVKKGLCKVETDVADIKHLLLSMQTILVENRLIKKDENVFSKMKQIEMNRQHNTGEEQSRTRHQISQWKKKVKVLLDSYIDSLTMHGATRE